MVELPVFLFARIWSSEEKEKLIKGRSCEGMGWHNIIVLPDGGRGVNLLTRPETGIWVGAGGRLSARGVWSPLIVARAQGGITLGPDRGELAAGF